MAMACALPASAPGEEARGGPRAAARGAPVARGSAATRSACVRVAATSRAHSSLGRAVGAATPHRPPPPPPRLQCRVPPSMPSPRLLSFPPSSSGISSPLPPHCAPGNSTVGPASVALRRCPPPSCPPPPPATRRRLPLAPEIRWPWVAPAAGSGTGWRCSDPPAEHRLQALGLSRLEHVGPRVDGARIAYVDGGQPQRDRPLGHGGVEAVGAHEERAALVEHARLADGRKQVDDEVGGPAEGVGQPVAERAAACLFRAKHALPDEAGGLGVVARHGGRSLVTDVVAAAVPRVGDEVVAVPREGARERAARGASEAVFRAQSQMRRLAAWTSPERPAGQLRSRARGPGSRSGRSARPPGGPGRRPAPPRAGPRCRRRLPGGRPARLPPGSAGRRLGPGSSPAGRGSSPPRGRSSERAPGGGLAPALGSRRALRSPLPP